MKLNTTMHNNYIIFNKIKNYIIKNSNYSAITANTVVKKENVKTSKTNNFKKHLVYPKQHDKFFWCFYILKHGASEYKNIDFKHFLIEKNYKLEFIDTIRKNISLLKENKIKKMETELDIVNSNKISLNSFYALCIYNNINVIILCKNIYYKLIMDEEQPINILDLSTPYIGCCSNASQELLNECINNKMYVENPNRPIRSMSFYKIEDLHDICGKLNIDIKYSSGKSKKKQDLYDEIKDLLF